MPKIDLSDMESMDDVTQQWLSGHALRRQRDGVRGYIILTAKKKA